MTRPVGVDQNEHALLGFFATCRGWIFIARGNPQGQGRLAAAPHREVGQDRRAGVIFGGDLELLFAKARSALEARAKSSGTDARDVEA